MIVWGVWVMGQKNRHTQIPARARPLKLNVHSLWGLNREKMVFQVDRAYSHKEREKLCLTAMGHWLIGLLGAGL